MSLLDKALSVDRTDNTLKIVGKSLEEDIELAIAWAEDKINNKQLAIAMGIKSTLQLNLQFPCYSSERSDEKETDSTERREMKADEVGRIWEWISTSQKKNRKDRPDVVLPHGFLYEADIDEWNYHLCCNSMRHVILLPNHDIVLGSLMQGSNKDELSQAWKDFFRDGVYLKNAVRNGTINLEQLPIVQKN